MWFRTKKSTSTSGAQKEQQASDWLQAQGFNILEKNYLCKGGEIDIIALSPLPSNNALPLLRQTKPEPTLVFFEIKYRKNSHYGHPSEFVTPQKQRRITQCAQFFLLNNTPLNHLPMRFDVITFEGKQTIPKWIKNAFGQ